MCLLKAAHQQQQRLARHQAAPSSSTWHFMIDSESASSHKASLLDVALRFKFQLSQRKRVAGVGLRAVGD